MDVRDGSFLHRVECGTIAMFFGHYLYLIRYLVLTAIQMSRSDLFILSLVFQSPVSSVIVINVIFLWLEYDRIVAKSGDPKVTAIHVSLNSRLFCLARVSQIIAMICHV